MFVFKGSVRILNCKNNFCFSSTSFSLHISVITKAITEEVFQIEVFFCFLSHLKTELETGGCIQSKCIVIMAPEIKTFENSLITWKR